MTANRVKPATVASVVRRDFGCCAVCGDELHGERGVRWSVHHRRRGGMGGDKRADANTEANLILLHGSGTTSCHGRVHSDRMEAYANGWAVHATRSPSSMPIRHAVHGLVLLTDGGGWTDVVEEVA